MEPCNQRLIEKAAYSERRTAVQIRSNCPSCGLAGDVKLFVHRCDSDWALCSCGLVYLQTAYPIIGQSAVQPQCSRYERRRRRRAAKSKRQILDVLNHVSPGPLLDIGCSLGYTLDAAAELGLDAVGVEIDADAVERCRRLGFHVEHAHMNRLPFDDGRFQIVTMKHVLEHTPDPRAALTEVFRVLAPGGGVFIAVPHLRYHKAIRSPETYKYFRFSGDGSGDGHYVYYTPDSLSSMLETLGFEVVKIDPHLIHRRAGMLTRIAQIVVSPARLLMRKILTALCLRKEFWLVAVRPRKSAL